MKTNNIKFVSIAGLSAAFALAAPLASAQTTDRQTNTQRSDSQLQDRGIGQRATSSTESKVRASSDIIGMDIQSSSNEKIGTVNNLYVDMNSGKIVAVVTSTGGLLDRNAQSSLLAIEDVRMDADNKHLRTDLSKEQLRSAPQYRKGETSTFDEVRPLGAASSRDDSPRAGSDRDVTDRIASSENNPANRRMTHQRSPGQSEAGQFGSVRTGSHNETAQKIAVSDLVGMDVENRAGDKIGSIDKLYLDLEEGQVIGAVVSTGGFLGIGAQQNVLALNELKYNAEQGKLSVDMTREQLRSAPTYVKDETSWHADLRERFNRIGNESRAHMGSTSREQADSSRTSVFNQGNSSAERKMTSDIRSAIREGNNMSSRANNVTVITQENKVLLRGEVDSNNEKTTIEDIANSKAGRGNVTSEIVVRSR